MNLEPLTVVIITIQYGFAVFAILWFVLALWQSRLRFRKLRLLAICCGVSTVIVIGLALGGGPFLSILVMLFIPIHIVLLVLAASMTIYYRMKIETFPLKPNDNSGRKIRKRNKVIFLEAPVKLLAGLPSEDQRAITEQVGKVFEVEGFDDYGHVEIVFFDKFGRNHSIWVEPTALKVQP